MFKKLHPPVGAQPGTLVPSADAAPPVIKAILYTPETVETVGVVDVSELASLLDGERLIWVDVQGLGDTAVLEQIAEVFSLHPLALEDVVNQPQRPKTEAYDEHQIYISRMVTVSDKNVVEIEQVTIFIGARYVLTFQERHGDVLDPVRDRVRQRGSRIRNSGSDYLAYRIIDTIIDHYYLALESISETLESLETRVMNHPTQHALAEINQMKRTLLDVRRGIWPQRDAVNALVRGDSPFVTEPVRVFLRDSYDHAVQITDVIETYRELAGGLFNTYLSVVSNKMNEVMKVLTIMASVFIPLTFLAGIYGMNFESMPELRQGWTYPALLMLMAVIAGGMFVYFARKGWIGSASRERTEDSGTN